MSNVSGQGTIWNLPGYTGELISTSPENCPLLTMMGGLAKGGSITTNFEFPLNSYYAHETLAQPAITETASLTAPTAVGFVRAQEKNVCQIFHEAVSVSYEKLAGQGRLSGISTAGQPYSAQDEMAFQVSVSLKHIARDIEYTIVQGAYQIATDAGVANKTRGLNEAASNASNTVAAGSVDLSKDLIDELIRTMYAANADFETPVFIVNIFQKQKLSGIYGYAPQDRTIGGVNIKQVETDIGNVGVLLTPFQSTSVLLLADLAKCQPVWQPVAGKGNFFYEALAKTGASENGQIFGKFGLDFGAGIYHGTITGLTTS
jgi:hypothetical protein